MRDYSDEANLHARVYALRSRLFSLKDYIPLARSQNGTAYGQTENVPDPVQAGETIFREQIAVIMPLAEASEIYSPLFLAFFRQFEALNVKLVLAKAFGLQSLGHWHDIGPYAILERKVLQEATSLNDIRTLLERSYLEDVFEDSESYEKMEVRVDLCAARTLHAASAPFRREAKRDFQALMGRRMAVTFTILSLRLKKTYNWDDGEIMSFMERLYGTPGGKARSQMTVVEGVLDRHLDHMRASGAQELSITDVEYYLEQYFYNWISSMFHRDFHSIYCVAAYLWLLYYQIRNLFKIIEGRRFGFSQERILARIICDRQG